MVATMKRTLAEKVWDRHVVRRAAGEPDLLYIDLHLVHELTSPQAFDGLRLARRRVRRPDLTLATMDHNVPTTAATPADDISLKQMDAMTRNAREFGIRLYPMGALEQGIVHVISPQLGLTEPGMTIVCGDSHTSTHGIIARIGVSGGVGRIIEYRRSTIRDLSMEGRMTICNMSIEAGAPAGMVAPDDTTYAYVERRQHAPKGQAWERALEDWRALPTDDGARFDHEVRIDASELRPYVSWGTNPAQTVTIDDRVPDPDTLDGAQREAATRALRYMDL